jgi:DNA-binding response OmpR family regulator
MRKKKIIVFEEFESIKNILIKSLEKKGYEVITLNSIVLADTIFNGIYYDVMIIDNDNQNDVSYKLIEKIRNISNYLYMPVILLISGDKKQYEGKYKNLNIACYLTKPFDMNHFYTVVERLA